MKIKRKRRKTKVNANAEVNGAKFNFNPEFNLFKITQENKGKKSTEKNEDNDFKKPYTPKKQHGFLPYLILTLLIIMILAAIIGALKSCNMF